MTWTDRLAAGFALGSPTSRPSGGGSGPRSRLGTKLSAISPTATIAATRATPRHLIRTPAIPSQGSDGQVLPPRA
jgi:hypothetical protein